MTLPQVPGYAVVEKIGSGSYSTVYKAFRKNGPREAVAIKCVEKSKLTGSAVDNIITEISLLKVLKHENIVEMKDFQWDDRYIYIIMEFCEAGDLLRFIHKRRKLPEAICKRFLQQLALALRFLRSHNVCHMDLKPQNLLLTAKPKLTLKVADFGFAQYLSTDEQNSSLRGSPLYMAPEILLKRKYDARVELWSVGVIMYECLFGKAPYSSSHFQELAEKIKARTPIEIPHSPPTSGECQDLLRKLLQHDPNQRIDYESFFQHPFLDLEHIPSSESYQKAIDLVCEAVKQDSEKNYSEAFTLYCDSLRYFVPLIHVETDPVKKSVLQSKVKSYIRRAEDLKKIVYGHDESNEEASEENRGINTHVDNGSPDFNLLCQLASRTPAMATALEIGYSAEQYMAECQYQTALDKFQSCLGILVPMLSAEPKGRRRDLLHLQIQQWLKQAEGTKAFLAVVNLDSGNIPETKEWCRMQ
ncbi:serine/threonine-protein kinase ULK3 [Anabrus simplex]|uniref:serine/threonine-protein kinase ULK3 n=1 Tax=Anabrus simplex TaxID=316456 RepID=UPI0035A38B92